jgi:membrane protein implicated in regulation of membrane protease activity
VKLASSVGLALTILWTILALLQLWLEIFSGDPFFKITVTCGLLLVLLVVGAMVYREFIRENELKDRGFID